MSKNVRMALLILLPVSFWFATGVLEKDKIELPKAQKTLSSVVINESIAEMISPTISVNSVAISEKRVVVKAKTSGEVVATGVRQGEWVKKDKLLCRLGIVELNRTEVKAPFDGYVENIVKPGNFIQRGEICATIIELSPITFVAEVPEAKIKDIFEGLQVKIDLITDETISSNLTFVSKSASPATRTFRVEAEFENVTGAVRDGITGTMHISTQPILAHKITASVLLLTDEGNIGVRTVNSDSRVEFHSIKIIKDTADGLWVSGIPQFSNLIVQGQGFVENGQTVAVTNLASL
jgi:multidrug efflux system membrane fusion protein